MNLVFVVGTGRCGSSLIHEILAKHEGMGFISNIEDNLPLVNCLGRWNNALYRSAVGNFTRKGGLRFAPSEAFKLISREVSPIYANSCRDLTAADVTPWLEKRFQLFFQQRHEAQRKAVFSHKYTGWSRITFFQKIFPQARFIHIVRDGRAVANSWLQMPWWGGYRGPENWLWGLLDKQYQDIFDDSGRSFPVLAALGWDILMKSYEASREQLTDDAYLELRYEDILAEPEASFTRMLQFSGLDWTPAFRDQFNKKTFNVGRRSAFRTDMTDVQLNQIERYLHTALGRYGYL